ncbi:MAG TPA: HAMP domain-containing protein, partial [Vicinamibacterales bacterium]|nr:HAMP domain-containing protein [Vicinamibacterales bacterium]
MPATVTSISSRPSTLPGTPGRGSDPSRRPFRDNPRLILAGIAVLVVALVALVAVARGSRFAPDFLSEFVLYALSVADLTMLVALLFVLARNVIKLIVERRKALPFARFRAKLVVLLLGMTVVPSVLVLVVGSELISQSVDRWFNAPMDEVLSSANRIASEYYRERQMLVGDHAARIARTLSTVDLSAPEVGPIRDLLTREVTSQRIQIVAVYRAKPGAAGSSPAVEPVVDVTAPAALPPEASSRRAGADRLAAQALAGSAEKNSVEGLGKSGDLLHAASVIRSASGQPVGVVVATDHLTGDLVERSRRMTLAFENYNQMRVLKRPLTGVYLSFFLMVTLLILVGATWMGLYMAKRITRPVQMLAAAAREIGAGHYNQRVEPQSHDEFGSLVDAFNAMASELAASRRRVDRSTIELERKHVEVEGRRRYIETILERITTGVVSVDAAGSITTINRAAMRLLGLDPQIVGQPFVSVFDRADLQPLRRLVAGASRPSAEPAIQEIAILREGQELHLAAVSTALVGESGTWEGVVLVLDDVTPLIRAQKVAAWREVARRLAHEIKNPLTPIQLCAERMRRHFSGAEPKARALVDECTSTIVGEVESLKGLVDEFSQFARMPSPRTVPTDLTQLIADALALYNGVVADVRIEQRAGPGIGLVRLDPEQIRRVVINLVDNAIEAMERRGEIVVETQLDSKNSVVRVIVADNGPGIPPAERE